MNKLNRNDIVSCKNIVCGKIIFCKYLFEYDENRIEVELLESHARFIVNKKDFKKATEKDLIKAILNNLKDYNFTLEDFDNNDFTCGITANTLECFNTFKYNRVKLSNKEKEYIKYSPYSPYSDMDIAIDRIYFCYIDNFLYTEKRGLIIVPLKDIKGYLLNLKEV